MSIEPSRVYGYISLVDPNTGQNHLILNRDYDPPIVKGYVTLNVVFRAGEQTIEVTFANGSGLGLVGVPPTQAMAYYYNLVQDRAETGNPRVVDSGLEWVNVGGAGLFEHRALSIHYSPDLWNFDSVQVGPYSYSDPNGTIPVGNHMETQIPLQPRATPFPTFPDIL
jgi:hypothetical protein